MQKPQRGKSGDPGRALEMDILRSFTGGHIISFDDIDRWPMAESIRTTPSLAKGKRPFSFLGHYPSSQGLLVISHADVAK
ncbi:hypothetical protein V6N11_043525 [Hibiscus sabdariffa]|uniref:Uncharacterized protein n=1 Tax=Hibiscus sabdariffa TaxID=183260 RepID=A0ABR2RCL4_9ROSI